MVSNQPLNPGHHVAGGLLTPPFSRWGVLSLTVSLTCSFLSSSVLVTYFTSWFHGICNLPALHNHSYMFCIVSTNGFWIGKGMENSILTGAGACCPDESQGVNSAAFLILAVWRQVPSYIQIQEVPNYLELQDQCMNSVNPQRCELGFVLGFLLSLPSFHFLFWGSAPLVSLFFFS